jgi:hypothetical protein
MFIGLIIGLLVGLYVSPRGRQWVEKKCTELPKDCLYTATPDATDKTICSLKVLQQADAKGRCFAFDSSVPAGEKAYPLKRDDYDARFSKVPSYGSPAQLLKYQEEMKLLNTGCQFNNPKPKAPPKTPPAGSQ